jgi:hypothetical protein
MERSIKRQCYSYSVWDTKRDYDDTFMIVCTFLTIQELLAIRMTCKYWSKITWKRKSWKHAVWSVKSESIYYLIEHLYELSKRRNGMGNLLQNMNIDKWDNQHYPLSYLSSFILMFPFLYKLEFGIHIYNNNDIQFIINALPITLRELHMTVNTTTLTKYATRVVTPLPNLEKLVINLETVSSTTEANELIQHLSQLFMSPKLQTIHLYNTCLPISVFNDIIKTCTKLSRFMIGWYPESWRCYHGLDVTSLLELEMNLSLVHLQEFDIHTLVTDKELLYFLEIKSLLKNDHRLHIDMDCEIEWKSEHIDILCRCTHITCIKLDFNNVSNYNYYQYTIPLLICGLGRLKHITHLFIMCSAIHTTDILCIVNSIQNLLDLTLQSKHTYQWQPVCTNIFYLKYYGNLKSLKQLSIIDENIQAKEEEIPKEFEYSLSLQLNWDNPMLGFKCIIQL